jgi:hypothetical protein
MTVSPAASVSPVRLEGILDESPSRWRWLAKWVLVIPHLLALVLLWVAFVPLTLVAFVSILARGRYPRRIFDVNVGIMRWTWRVAFYSYSALGTDQYPPFSLKDVADYPARLHIEYPKALSRRLVLVKSWLLALPHYLIVGVFTGGAWAGLNAADDQAAWSYAGGLVGLLVLIAGMAVLFTGQYPRSIFDFVMGMNRWVVRVTAYAALMTDAYPPLRLDLGAREPDAHTAQTDLSTSRAAFGL